jgi:hypothetical protein
VQEKENLIREKEKLFM